MDQYLKAIKENVCSICVDSTEKGACTLSNKETCAVEFYLPQILEIVLENDSENINEINSKLKETICVECRAQDENGDCYLREEANCSLDRYFSLIVETIRKVEKGFFNNPGN